MQQGNMQITEVLQEAGLDISSLTGGGKDDDKTREEDSSGAGSSRDKAGSEGIMESIQKSAASVQLLHSHAF